MSNIKIIDYRPEHQPYFEKFNREWIEEMFEIEPLDEWVLTNPHEAILKPGGAILMATYNDIVAGTVGLRKTAEGEFEFTKMAVDKNYRRKGIAEALSFASFRKAKDLGAKQVILYSNKRNAGAVLLYEKIGFKHLEVEEGIYKRADVKMIISIEDAIQVANAHYNRSNNFSYEHQND
jgi:ribosomal protein S18 acetylase RimI-like enzyme